MALTFHPRPGMVLICDFNTGFKAPEMIKRRPVVVISPRPRRSNQLCTIVPLSTTVPNPVEPFHHRMDPRSLPGKLAGKET
ncbi:MAG: type II toxin-antitoxin system PemK/MazF family toxin, partial [Candidatus Thiosymbion ectosymbiont of Robbea hypermnestra]|nr:type II toxin-antitoxin system PemK/MazF family toxin [Candidatus Thiosymbion ectosymbiont of Robbea hypermnestra]